MDISKIVLIVLLAVVSAAGIVWAGSLWYIRHNSTGFTTIGTIQYWTKSKLPFMECACIRYTVRGAPREVMTSNIPVWRKKQIPKTRMWYIRTIRQPKGEKRKNIVSAVLPPKGVQNQSTGKTARVKPAKRGA